MSRPVILWLAGMVSVFAGQRLYAGHDTPSAVLSLGGLALVLAAIGLAAKGRKSAADDGTASSVVAMSTLTPCTGRRTTGAPTEVNQYLNHLIPDGSSSPTKR